MSPVTTLPGSSGAPAASAGPRVGHPAGPRLRRARECPGPDLENITGEDKPAARRGAAAAAVLLVAATAAAPLSTALQPDPPTAEAAIAYPDDRADMAEMKRAARSRPKAPPQRPAGTAATGRAQNPATRPPPRPRLDRHRDRAEPRRQRQRDRGATRRGRADVDIRIRVRVHAGGARARVVAFALSQIGKPYIWAADGPYGFDCSGLALASYRTVGIRLPHQTGGIVGYGRRVSRRDLQPGDLVFPSPGHVGIYIGGGRMVHAPQRGDHVRVAPLYGFWTARRLL